MDHVALGSTGLTVSVAAFGMGGRSRAGVRAGLDERASADLVHQAIDAGVTLVDTAEAYGTEPILARVLAERPRDEVVVSTKASLDGPGGPRDARALEDALVASLRRLGTDHVDIYHLHGVPADAYDHALHVLRPVLEVAKDNGTIRAIGITEAFVDDTTHATLGRAVTDPGWDVVMVGFNLLNQSARDRVLGPAAMAGVGTLGMFAVRSALSSAERFTDAVSDLVRDGHLDAAVADDPVGWLLDGSDATDVPSLAYRFCRAEAHLDTILFGTGNPDHLAANLAALGAPPLPEAVVARIRAAFAGLDHLSAH